MFATSIRRLLSWWCDASFVLERAWVKLNDDSSKLLESTLRQRLRTYPYWTSGHLDLGRIAFQQGNGQLVYNCSQAAFATNPCLLKKLQAQWLLGRAYLLLGAGAQACLEFEKLPLGNFTTREARAIREDSAAAHVLVGDYSAALRELEGIGESFLTSEALAALSFVRGKLGQGV